ncbi:MAG: hypothetical protein ACT4TC_25350 [Myxococcaceae bacterium]
MKRILALLPTLLLACGGSSQQAPPPNAGVQLPLADGGTQLLDVSQQGLIQLIRGGGYKGWRSEPAPHASAGPHGGRVRTWLNDALYASSAAKNETHPNGSISVKELYGQGAGTTPTGFAVDVKDNTGTWVFLEGFEPTLTQYYFRGTGNLCSGCHGSGDDFLLTPATAVQ